MHRSNQIQELSSSGPKIGGCAALGEGELGPHLAQCGQGRGLPACQVWSWTVQSFGHSARPSLTDRTDRQTGQGTDSIGRTVLETVAQKSLNTWQSYAEKLIATSALCAPGTVHW